MISYSLGALGLVAAVSGLFMNSAVAMPLATEAMRPLSPASPPAVDLVNGAVDFTAIVALSNCSGSLVRFETSIPTDQAMVLTNGHCLGGWGGFLQPGEVEVDQSASRSFALLDSTASGTLGTLHADRVLYATMTATDITLYRLQETYEQIDRSYHVQALTISSRHPEAGRAISVVSGYWKRIYNCAIDKFIYELHEAGWTMKDSIRYTSTGCETIPGTSGSPVIDSETHEVVGVNNTGNEKGEQCTMDNPCEVDSSGGISVIQGASYGQETYWLYSCLENGNHLNLAKPGCLLPRP